MFLEPLIEINRFLYRQNLKIMLLLYRWGLKSLYLHLDNFKEDKAILRKIIERKQRIKSELYSVRLIDESQQV